MEGIRNTKFGSENLKGRDHFRDLGVDGDNIKMDLKDIESKDVDCIRMAQNRVQWRALMNTVMRLPVL
jgi:hypothetical protein